MDFGVTSEGLGSRPTTAVARRLRAATTLSLIRQAAPWHRKKGPPSITQGFGPTLPPAHRNEKGRSKRTGLFLAMVAGTGFEPVTFRL